MIAKSKGFVIKRKIYRDTSLLIKFYTYDYGKIEGIVKGVRKIEDYGRYDGLINLLSNYEVVFYPGKANLALFVQFYLLNSYWRIFQDYYSFNLICWGLKLLDFVMQPYQANTEIYKLLKFYLEEMDKLQEHKKFITFYAFVIKLLKYCGFSPQVNECVKCSRKIYNCGFFATSEGGLICQGCKDKVKDFLTLTPATIKYINFIEKASFTDIKKIRISQKISKELNKVLFNFISYHISFTPTIPKAIAGIYV